MTTLSDEEWYHVMALFNEWDGANGDDIILYVNGTEDNRGDSGFNDQPNYDNDPPTIGRDLNDSQFADGIIDDVRVFNRALSAKEVQRLYELGN